MIPRNIFQTQKSQNFIESKYKLKEGQDSWKKHEAYGFKYHFYNDEECDSFMKKNFNDIYDAYQKLPIPVMKADLWRYCIIYHYGGIYADADTYCNIKNLNDIFIKKSNLIGTVEDNLKWICNWVFSAPPKSPILKEVINLSVQKIRDCKNFKVEHITHDLTGPDMFSDGIENYLILEGKPIYKHGQYRKAYSGLNNSDMIIYEPTDFHNNKVYHLFSGQWSGGWIEDANELTGIEHIKITIDEQGNPK
jgi:mannosyltransferase OCH1-like enzyme